MPKKSLEAIVKQCVRSIFESENNTDPTDDYQQEFDIVVQSIKDYYLAKLPKERDFRGNGSEWNNAIAEMRKAIEEG